MKKANKLLFSEICFSCVYILMISMMSLLSVGGDINQWYNSFGPLLPAINGLSAW